jgi:hypothetical protein
VAGIECIQYIIDIHCQNNTKVVCFASMVSHFVLASVMIETGAGGAIKELVVRPLRCIGAGLLAQFPPREESLEVPRETAQASS